MVANLHFIRIRLSFRESNIKLIVIEILVIFTTTTALC